MKKSQSEIVDCKKNNSLFITPPQEPKGTCGLFYNLPELIRPEVIASVLGLSVKTIYDWKYRWKTRNVPENLFFKINRFIYIRKSVLEDWLLTQNSI